MSKEKSDLWFYYHKESKQKVGPKNLADLCTHLINEKINLELILLCQPGWPKWLKTFEVEIFCKQYELANSPETLLEEHAESYREDHDEEYWIKMRKHPRIEVELKAVFVDQNKSFRTTTIDLSLGGIKINDSLPETFLHKKILVFLTSKDQTFSIKFEAEIITNKTEFNQIQFLTQNELSVKHLEKWIHEHGQKSKSLIKKIA